MENEILEKKSGESMSIDRVRFVEKHLKVKLPSDYATFLSTFGDYEMEGFEIYGYNEAYQDINKIPCVIGATKLYAQDYNLDLHQIVIAHSGFEDFIVILDTKTNEIFEKSTTGKVNPIAKNFHSWFESIRSK